MKRAEQILWATLLFTIILQMSVGTHISFIALSACLLACFYFYLSLWLLNDIPLRKAFSKGIFKDVAPLRIIGSIGVGFAYATAIISILFKVAGWPGSIIMLIFSTIMLAISILVATIKRYKSRQPYFYRQLIKRTLLMLCIIASLIGISFLPPDTQSHLFHRQQRVDAAIRQ